MVAAKPDPPPESESEPATTPPPVATTTAAGDVVFTDGSTTWTVRPAGTEIAASPRAAIEPSGPSRATETRTALPPGFSSRSRVRPPVGGAVGSTSHRCRADGVPDMVAWSDPSPFIRSATATGRRFVDSTSIPALANPEIENVWTAPPGTENPFGPEATRWLDVPWPMTERSALDFPG